MYYRALLGYQVADKGMPTPAALSTDMLLARTVGHIAHGRCTCHLFLLPQAHT